MSAFLLFWLYALHHSDILAGMLILSICYFNLIEWALHRYVMHKPIRTPFGTYDYPFERHAKVHHHIFKADHTYHLIHEEDKRTIPMAWWNGPLLVLIGSSPVIIVGWLLHCWLTASWMSLGSAQWLSIIVPAAGGCYYGIYERIHWCMHLPRDAQQRLIERSWTFRRLNGHHILHHRYMHKNFNVVLPLADLYLRTLCLRSKMHFPQVMGASVPNVQPVAKRPWFEGLIAKIFALD